MQVFSHGPDSASHSEAATDLCRRSFLRQLHGPLELRRFFFDAEIVGIEFLDFRHVVRRQRRGVGRFCKFDELFFVVNVRQRRSDAIIRQQPLQRCLSKRALGIFEKS